MAFFEEKKAVAAASALTLLVLATSFHSALSQDNAVTTPARPAAQAAAPASPASVPTATATPAAAGQPPASASPAVPPPSSPAGNSGESIPAANGASAALEPANGAAEVPQDLSAWGMFLHADRVVKTVMIGLALSSLATWAIWLAKSLELRTARSEVEKDLRVLGNCSTLAEANGRLLKRTSPVARLMQGAADEIRPPSNCALTA
jgi:biopolymer transport protein ExbB